MWTLGGADLSYADWYQLVNGTPLGFIPTAVGDARVFGGQVYQAVSGSTHVASYLDPNAPGDDTSTVPEPENWALMLLGFVSI